MIKATLKNKIKKVLGAHYSSKIIAHLNSVEVFNSKGEPYTSKSIQAIVNATNERENLTVESHILDLLAKTQRNNRTKNLKQSKILKTK